MSWQRIVKWSFSIALLPRFKSLWVDIYRYKDAVYLKKMIDETKSRVTLIWHTVTQSALRFVCVCECVIDFPSLPAVFKRWNVFSTHLSSDHLFPTFFFSIDLLTARKCKIP